MNKSTLDYAVDYWLEAITKSDEAQNDSAKQLFSKQLRSLVSDDLVKLGMSSLETNFKPVALLAKAIRKTGLDPALFPPKTKMLLTDEVVVLNQKIVYNVNEQTKSI